MAGYRVACAGAVIASTGLAAWVLLRRHGELQRETAQRLAAEQQCKLLRAEVERLEAGLSVALRREEERAREAQRHVTFFAEERDALEDAREALAAREEQHKAEQVEARKVLESSRERSAELRRHNAEKAETVEQLRLELEALRRANNSSTSEPVESEPAPATPDVAADVPVTTERRAKAAQDSGRRRARMNERRELAAKLDALVAAPSS